ncbi:MAG TPA: NUDIX hydrolase [Candidatus Paceibacterota bacterium]|nr:NUDIX hydrolase [Candidatus Paceibacterota bacterium]
MEMEKTKEIFLKDTKHPVKVYALGKNAVPSTFSRVYAIAFHQADGLVPVIFNSKRNIWGFPGGHRESGEAFSQTIKREMSEETGFDVIFCEPRYCISSILDNDHEENQIICFCIVKKSETREVDPDETVTEVKMLPIQEVLAKVNNKELWENMLDDFSLWVQEEPRV